MGRGFTLIELLVVMSIMVIVTGVLLVQQSKFDSATLLRSLAYSVGLSVRQAQVYGTSVFGTTTSVTACGSSTYQSGTCFAQGYGIYVLASNPSSYTLFADLDNNGTYSGNTEIVKVFSLGQGYSVSRICALTTGTPVEWCSGSGVTWLAMVFRRPNPEACITTNSLSGGPQDTNCRVGFSSSYATSSIQIRSGGAGGSTRSIYINSTGQISVGNSGT